MRIKIQIETGILVSGHHKHLHENAISCRFARLSILFHCEVFSAGLQIEDLLKKLWL